MSDKYVVRENPQKAYRFTVSQDLGEDWQGGHWYKPIANFTHRDSAEEAARQLNESGELYLPGMVLPISEGVRNAREQLQSKEQS